MATRNSHHNLQEKQKSHKTSDSGKSTSTKELSTLVACLRQPASTILTQGALKGAEISALETFRIRYDHDRRFLQGPLSAEFEECLSGLVTGRLCCKEWFEAASYKHIQAVLTCLRVLLRDSQFLLRFHEYNATELLAQMLERYTEAYYSAGVSNVDGSHAAEMLKELTNIFLKIANDAHQRDKIIEAGAHKSLVLLLSANDITILHCSMFALISLAQSTKPRGKICELHCIETLIRILQEYDVSSKKNAACLLRLLLADRRTNAMVKLYDGVPVLLSQLQSNDGADFLWHVVWCLVQLAEDQEAGNLICGMGGIPLILSLLSENKSPCGTNLNSNTSGGSSASIDENEGHYTLKSACCAAITELVLNDTNAQQVIRNNGVYQLSVLLLPEEGDTDLSPKQQEVITTLQRSVFRALRFLFGMERNRSQFKKLFPPALYEAFIDVGHYVRDINAYRSVVDRMNGLSREDLSEIRENIQACNQNKDPSQRIREYDVLEHLGSGAFGSVYKARKQGNEPGSVIFYAIKEVNTTQAALGRTAKERDKSVGEIISELTIIKEQLRHPNVVRYYRTFVDNERLYIVMELIEGSSLAEHFNFLREKKTRFSEERINTILVQLILVLRYLHKEKAIVHRDLSPNNIMLDERDRVTVTDFGLAKRKRQDCSQMDSVVGTIVYACPEIVQNQPYGEKADVWSLGCVLYQMANLQPPFNSTNMLTLARNIVDAKYEAISPGLYSDQIRIVVAACLTSNPDKRPDIVGVAGLMTNEILLHLDSSRITSLSTERKLDRERRRLHRYYIDSNRQMQDYHRLMMASRDYNHDRQASPGSGCGLAGSGGGRAGRDSLCSEESGGVGGSRPNSGSISGSVRGGNCVHQQLNRQPSSEIMLQELEELTIGADNCMPDMKLTTPQSPVMNSTHEDHHSRLLSMEMSNNVSSLTSSEFSLQSPTIQFRMMGNRLYKGRPDSGGTLTISQRRLRPVTDPILRLFSLVHKLVFISQLPPTCTANPRRRLVDRFKRALFSVNVTAVDLKEELRRLMTGSRELIDLDLGLGEEGLLSKQASSEQFAVSVNADKGTSDLGEAGDHGDGGITYEQMLAIMEGVLEEIGYYDPDRRIRTPGSPMCVSSAASAQGSSGHE